MSAVVIIPARYDSSRFPGKPIVSINGRPMLAYVYEGAKRAALIDNVIIATDDLRIFEAARGFCDHVVMTSRGHRCGTERIAEVAEGLSYDIIVNVQADEPLINGQMIDDVVSLLAEDSRAHIATLKRLITIQDEIFDPNVVKVVTDREGFALYFSRSPIAFNRELFTLQGLKYDIGIDVSALSTYKHIGIYGYRRQALLDITAIEECELERTERLEQLRCLYHGFRIKVRDTAFDTIGVDSPEDIEKVREWLNTYS